MISKSLLKEIEKFARGKHKKSDYNHDIRHIIRTVKLAKRIAKKEKADLGVCVVAAWLHDVGQSIQIKDHHKYSMKLAEPFLKKLGFDKKFTDKVLHCIYCHSTKNVDKAKTIEAKVVYDSDMLQVMGAFGFVRILTHESVFNKLNLDNSIKKSRELAKRTNKKLQTRTAKALIKNENRLMEKFHRSYDKWDNGLNMR